MSDSGTTRGSTRTELDALVLTYRVRVAGGDWKDVVENILIVHAPSRWLSLSEQRFGLDKWNVCRAQAAAICGKPLK